MMFIVLYVDDFLMSKRKDDVESIKETLKKKFKMKDIGVLTNI